MMLETAYEIGGNIWELEFTIKRRDDKSRYLMIRKLDRGNFKELLVTKDYSDEDAKDIPTFLKGLLDLVDRIKNIKFGIIKKIVLDLSENGCAQTWTYVTLRREIEARDRELTERCAQYPKVWTESGLGRFDD